MSSEKHTNKLIEENSPYLLQHAHNPVNWFPWGEEALEKARKEQKLLIISVGYSACHWCHVMEKESFENEDVAGLMNEYFISIKVDREERPDIDDIYMSACHLTSRRGCGWPLNAFALPDGRPVWAGTYFPRENWKSILQQFVQFQTEEPDRLELAANQILQGINQMNLIPDPENKGALTENFFIHNADQILRTQDTDRGGRLGSPKFPMPGMYQFLLQYYYHFHRDEALKAVTTTLDHMMSGGIYDQLGGGFARYSVDANWFAPHFEKMLYDNAQLISLYADLFRMTQKKEYRKIVLDTIRFAERELESAEGGFYSALDADSEGEEGTFYVWTAEEIRVLLGNEADIDLCFKYFNIEEEGNWEHGKNILFRRPDTNTSAGAPGQNEEAPDKKMEDICQLLFDARQKRPGPGLDDKILTSWNGLMLKAFTDAYKAFGDQVFLSKSEKLASFILTKMMDDNGRLFRSYKMGNRKINGFLDDYAHLISGLIGLYEITFNEKWVEAAKKMSDYVLKHFYSPERAVLYYTSDLDPPLIARKSEMTDNVIPGAVSAMAKNLFFLGKLFQDGHYNDVAENLWQKAVPAIEQNGPDYYFNWLQLGMHTFFKPFEVSIAGNKAQVLARELFKDYLPNCIFSGSDQRSRLPVLKDKAAEEQTLIYICRGNTCLTPVHSVQEALRMLRSGT